MFILSTNTNALSAVKKYQKTLDGVSKVHEISEFELPFGYKLLWASLKPSDNLHVFTDGYIIGKLEFNEITTPEPIHHDSKLIERKNTLTQNTIIKIGEDDINVFPNEQTNIYYTNNSVSDYQLLIAKNEALQPDYLRISLMCCTGYFPGDICLFEEIKKISYLHSLNVVSNKEIQETQFELQKTNDKKLIQRFQSLIPEDVKSGICLSGGMDSRFVLGLLMSKKVNPTVYSRSHTEDELVQKIADTLGLESHIVLSDKMDPFQYTLATDARIYYRGGNYSQLKGYVKPDEIVYNGLWSGATIENSWKVAWKKPGLIKNIFEDIIRHGILNTTYAEMEGLKDSIHREDIKQFLIKELDYQNKYYDFPKRKIWAAWYYHINKGVSRLPAGVADLGYYTYPVFLLGDKKAVEIGLGSSAYSNFYKERVRRLNQKLYPKHQHVEYAGGRSFTSMPPIVIDFYKLYYEYAYKFVHRYKETKKFMKGVKQEDIYDLTFDQSSRFNDYFINDLSTNVNSDNINYSIKRVMITVNHVLKFLED